ncbi:MAG: hypothetical protein LBC75_03675 [Fibromonadaceae bacterium]|jgi:very-short-patch-repair endonuclease|nr:hypothetical protein [Fibromonadaceae bacterium]
MKKENTYINEKFKEICKRLSEQDKEYSEKNEKRGKKYENYVVYAIWNRLKNCDLEPVREKGITCKDRKKYRIDLYFPQLNIGIECDEQHHENQKEEDKKREKKIREVKPGYKEFRIKIYSKESEKEISFEKIESKINEIVEKIKERIKSKKIEPWNPPPRASEQYFKRKKTISTDDYVVFGSQRDALKMIFSWESSNKQSRGFFTPKTLVGEYKKYKVWFPKLGSRYANYGNKWNKKDVFSEGKDLYKLNKQNRLIFVGLDDGEKYKFAGVFKYYGEKEKRAYWKRISKEFPIVRTKPSNPHRTVSNNRRQVNAINIK